MWRRVVGPALAGLIMLGAVAVYGTASAGTTKPIHEISIDDPAAAEFVTLADDDADAAAAATCSGRIMCFWEHANAGGHQFNLAGADGEFGNNPCPGCRSSKHPGSNGTWRDQLTSFKNQTGHNFCFWFDSGWTGTKLTIRATETRLYNVATRYNDEFNSGGPQGSIC